ncbi:olfactory receptor 8D1-like [Discoglossus pictus]
MEQKNGTTMFFFILKGISDVHEMQLPIFLLVLLLYLITLGGNMTILLLVWLDPQLHTPMYFFLGNLSFIDMSSTTVNLHKILTSFLSGDNTISFSCCMAQLYMFASLTIDELLILTAMTMSYDRYVAICKPLHYHMIMNRRVCVMLAMISWGFGFMEVLPTLWATSNLTCYKSNIVNHFFCDVVPLKQLTCSDTFILDLYVFIEGGLIVFFTPFILTFISYIFIVTTILKIRSSSGRRKAFYTCSSHLTVVILLYLTIFCQYFRPESVFSLDANKLFSLFNTAAVPILNPLIYSLKNKDVKSALRRQLRLSKCTV